MQGARNQAESSLSDAEGLEAVARDALRAQSDGDERADVRRLVVLYTCKSCERTEVETGGGAVELEIAPAAAIACGSQVCDLEHEGRTVVTGGAIPSAVRRAVFLRDRMRCRAPGCSRRRYVDVHHVRPRERGGEHSRRNCVTLCTSCHDRVHAGKLRIDGDAEGELRFSDGSGQPLGAVDATPWGHAAGLSREASTLLGVMGKRGGWHSDELHTQSGLSISEVLGGLVELELAGRVRRGAYGHEPALRS